MQPAVIVRTDTADGPPSGHQVTRATLKIVQAARTKRIAQNTRKGHALRLSTGQLLFHRLDQLDVNTFPFPIVY